MARHTVTVEPRMEELLASIRKAIQDDIGDVPNAAALPPGRSNVAGSMRELRVRVADEVTSASEEISGLRDRIQRNRTLETPRERRETPAPVNAPAKPGSFSTAFAPEPQSGSWRTSTAAPASRFETPSRSEPQRFEPSPRYEPPRSNPSPPLRPSYAEQDMSTADSFAAPDTYRAPPPRGRFGREVEALQQQEHPSWREAPPALPPPDSHRASASQPMLSDDATAAASSAFNRLTDNLLSRAFGERSIEDMTRELLRGMLKQWLDDNLPSLVENLVREEIERVARRGR